MTSHKKKANSKLKKVLAHLKDDQKTFKEEIKDDKKLAKQIKKGK